MTVDEGGSDRLRAERTRLVADERRRGRALGEDLAALLDRTFADLFSEATFGDGWCLVAMGSYGRRELCPGSDVDVMALTASRRSSAVEEAAAAAWYPLWDAGFVLGHSVRSMREALALAGDDPEALTALLEARLVAGDPEVADDLRRRVRALALRRRRLVIEVLSDAARARREHPGPIAEMLEPDLKRGAGGLRDLQALEWVGWSLEAEASSGLERLVALGYLLDEDRFRLARVADELLDVRVGLHRSTGARSDVLALQEQDAVAARLGDADADALVRRVARAGRTGAWVAGDVWDRLCSTVAGPRRGGAATRPAQHGVVVRDGRVALDADAPVDLATVVRAGLRAAELGTALERASLARAASIDEVSWGSDERAAFVALLATGRRAVPVLEAFDHVGVLARLLPEWERVRSLPQRNAYHRFTVDRHLLEAVAECAALRDEDGFDGEVARRVPAELLLLAALLHDVAKGMAGDHSVVGAEVARAVAARMGVDERSAATLAWAVRHHLLLAETATRRDLADETTVLRFGRAVGTVERLDLLYALTVGDARATGSAAWSRPKAALVRELYLRADALLEAGVVDTSERARRHDELVALVGEPTAAAVLEGAPPGYVASFGAAEMARHAALAAGGVPALQWDDVDGLVRATVVAPDRPGLLARVATALATLGLDVRSAAAFTRADGIAVEVFEGEDTFGRLATRDDRARAADAVGAAATGRGDGSEALRERHRRYRRTRGGRVATRVDLDASEAATVVEVEAPDEVGLLATVASVFADLGLDVTQAKVQTLGERVVDVFYVRDSTGARITDRVALERLRATLVARLTTEYSLPEPPP